MFDSSYFITIVWIEKERNFIENEEELMQKQWIKYPTDLFYKNL